MFSSSTLNPANIRRSFSYTSSGRPSAKAQALPKEFFTHLIKLESDFQSNSYTVETLDELVQLYAKAVEYYDSIQDEISSYFTYKIQDILATKRSLKMLIDRKQQEKAVLEENAKSPLANSDPLKLRHKDFNINPTKLQNPIKESLAEDSSDEEGEQNRRHEWEKKKEANKTSKSLASLKSQRQRFAQFYQKIEVEKNSYQEDMHIVFSSYAESAKENDQAIQKAINTQKQKIKQKLEQRKNKNLLTYTLNNTMSNATSSPRGLFNLSEQLSKQFEWNDENILQDFELQRESSSNKSLGDGLTPLLRKHLRSKSLFTKKEESSASKAALDNRNNNREAKEVELQENVLECTTPTEKLSTDNSFTLNEANTNLVEI